MNFNRAIFRIESDEERETTLLEVKRDNESGWTKCLEYDKEIGYQVRTYISSGGMNPKRRAVFINSIKFYDNETQIEGE